MCDDSKDREKPLYPNEIADNASNWNFAADLGLLKYLEVFSEDLLSRATIVDKSVNNLLNDLSAASLSLDIAKNKFLSLSNTQFIESRVYEDDEASLSNQDKTAKEEPDGNDTEDNHKNEMRLAALRGIEVLNKYFDRVQVIDSDSEGDDTDLTSFVLRPKDPYIDRPLPYIIGSDKWNKRVHVGLEDSSSESENEKISDKYSDTDSDLDLPTGNQFEGKSLSGSGSSEADLSNKLDHPVANSTFNDTNKQDDYLGSSDESISERIPIAQNLFAEQLVAKLGDVIKNNSEEPVINSRPIQNTMSHERYGSIFSDEPPPLDDYNDEFSPKAKNHGIFSGGDGLFDDLNDDEPFWGSSTTEKKQTGESASRSDVEDDLFSDAQNNVLSPTESKTFIKELDGKLKNKQNEPSIFDENDDDFLFGNTNSVNKSLSTKLKKPRSLFVDADQSSDDIENAQIKDRTNADSLFENANDDSTKPTKKNSLFNDEDPARKKAPVGGIQVISNPNIFADQNIKKFLKDKRHSSSESSDNAYSKDEVKTDHNVTHAKKQTDTIVPQKDNRSNNLFGGDEDDDDDLFKGDLFSNFSSNTTTNIFGRSGGLFDDSNESNDEDQSEWFKPERTKDSLKKNTALGKSLDGVVGNVDGSLKEPPKVAELPNKSEDHLKESGSKSLAVNSLFSGNDESDSDDLFSSKNSKIISKSRVLESTSLTGNESKKIEIKENSRKKGFLFDDDLENEDDDLFSSNFLQHRKPHQSKTTQSELKSGSLKKTSLFDDDEDEDLFSVKGSMNNADNGIFGSGALFKAKLEPSNKENIDDLLHSKSSHSNRPDAPRTDNLGGKTISNERSDVSPEYDLNKRTADSQHEDVVVLFGHNLEKEMFNTANANTRRDELLESNNMTEKDLPQVTTDRTNVSHLKTEVVEDNLENGLVNEDHREESIRIKTDNFPKTIESDEISNISPQIDAKSQLEGKSMNNLEAVQSVIEEKAGVKESCTANEDESLRAKIFDVKRGEGAKEEMGTIHSNHDTNTKEDAFSSITQRVPAVNIFDPSPPPDLGDWDTRSELNIFDDDIYTFDNSENLGANRSSIFDREPPSVFNESSGIVRDQSARLETDISSFYPYASSSRRFSSDLYNEEQTSDSLLTTKNVFHSFQPNIPPSIVENTEDTFSNVDITPSGKLEDLYSESSEYKQPKSVTFEDDASKDGGRAKVKAEPVEVVTEDKKKVESKPSVLRKPTIKRKVYWNGEEIKGDRRKSSEGLGDQKENVADKKTYNLDIPSSQETIAPVENEGAPGKLKHNLNINVFALLPGAEKAQKKERKEEKQEAPSRLQRSASLDLGKPDVDGDLQVTPKEAKTISLGVGNNMDDTEVLESVTKTRARGPGKRRPSTKRGRDAIRNSCVDFTFISNSPAQSNKNETKRAVKSEKQFSKDEVLEKPSQTSRSVNTSAVVENAIDEFTDDIDVQAENIKSNSQEQFESFLKVKVPASSILTRPATIDFLNDLTTSQYDLDDAMKVDSSLRLPTDMFEESESVTEVPERVSTKRIDFFSDLMSISDSLNLEEKRIVDNTLSTLSHKKKDLFSDDTDDADLFSSYGTKRNENSFRAKSDSSRTTNAASGLSEMPDRVLTDTSGEVFAKEESDGDLFSERKVPKSNSSKLTLFDDDEDDDLFGVTTKDNRQGNTEARITSRRLKTSNMKKLENITGDDPLNALNK